MKKAMNRPFRHSVLLLCCTLLVSLSSAWADDLWQVQLPFQQATINYTLTGGQTGTETLYIRDSGREQARYRTATSKMIFGESKIDEIEITTPDWVYSIDLTTRSGSKSANPIKFMQEEYDRLSSSEQQTVRKNMEEMGMAAMRGMQGSVQQKAATLLGYACDKVSMTGSTTWSLHKSGIPLKSEINMMGMHSIVEATSVDTAPVSADRFVPPANIAIEHDQEADRMSRSMAKSMIDSLKSPHAAQQMPQQASPFGSVQPPPASQANGDQPSREEMEKAMETIRGVFGNPSPR